MSTWKPQHNGNSTDRHTSGATYVTGRTGDLYENEWELEGSRAFLSFLVPSSQKLNRQISVALNQILQGCLCLQQLLRATTTKARRLQQGMF